MCIQQRFKSVCTPAQSDQSLSFPPEETLKPWLPIGRPSKTQISLHRCTGWSESSMSAHANLYLLLGTNLFLFSFHMHIGTMTYLSDELDTYAAYANLRIYTFLPSPGIAWSESTASLWHALFIYTIKDLLGDANEIWMFLFLKCNV